VTADDRSLGMLRAILFDYQDVISGPDLQRGQDAIDQLANRHLTPDEVRSQGRCPYCGWRTVTAGPGIICGPCVRALNERAVT
jgi:tRNA(Ile2) C34 agmatinyltransferase TiaS